MPFFFQSRYNNFHKKRKTKIQYQHHHHEHQHPTAPAEFVCTNEDLVNTILSKLKLKRSLNHKLVSKTWYKAVTGRPFVLKLPPPSDLAIQRYTRQTGPPLYPPTKYLTVKLDSKYQLPDLPEPFLHFLEANELHENGIRITQSCNGLFLCPSHAYHANVKHYVYNPTTNKTRLIPLPSHNPKRQVTSMNLAFDPSSSLHYKVISLSKIDEGFFSYTRVDIYYSETQSWAESKADFSPFQRNSTHVDFGKGVFFKGKLHWPSYKGDTSVCFDVGNECFVIFPMPEIRDGEERSVRFFGESGGGLLLIDSYEPSPVKFDVLEMDSDYSGWSVKYSVDFSDMGRVGERFSILSVVCEADEKDLLLVIYVPGRDRSGKGLMTYSLRDNELRKVNSPVPLWDLRLMEQKGFLVVHPLIRTKFAV